MMKKIYFLLFMVLAISCIEEPTEDQIIEAIETDNLSLFQNFCQKDNSIKNTPAFIFKIIENDRIEFLEYILKNNSNPDMIGPDSETPLIVAARENQYRAASLLLDSGANLHYKKKNGETVLHIAIQNNSFEVIMLLIDKGADVNLSTSPKNETPLHYAIYQNNIEIIKYLIDHGAEINTINYQRLSSLALSLLKKSTELTNLLLEKGAKLFPDDIYHKEAIILLIETNSIELGRLLFNQVKKYKQAISDGYNYSLDLDKRGIYPLLLKEISKNNDELLIDSVMADAKNILGYLIETGMNPSDYSYLENNTSLLHIAVTNNYIEIVELLLEAGKMSPDITSDSSTTPLLSASYYGFLSIVELLIDYKANINCQDRSGQSPLHYAVESENKELVELLLENGADVNIKDNSGKKPIDYSKNEEILLLLD